MRSILSRALDMSGWNRTGRRTTYIAAPPVPVSEREPAQHAL